MKLRFWIHFCHPWTLWLSAWRLNSIELMSSSRSRSCLAVISSMVFKIISLWWIHWSDNLIDEQWSGGLLCTLRCSPTPLELAKDLIEMKDRSPPFWWCGNVYTHAYAISHGRAYYPIAVKYQKPDN
jgi:hypothetical protein